MYTYICKTHAYWSTVLDGYDVVLNESGMYARCNACGAFP